MPRPIVSLDARRDRIARRATSNGSEQELQSAGPALHRRAAAGSYCIGPHRQDEPASLEMIDRQEGELFRQSASLPPA
jgi:hypothetical protein